MIKTVKEWFEMTPVPIMKESIMKEFNTFYKMYEKSRDVYRELHGEEPPFDKIEKEDVWKKERESYKEAIEALFPFSQTERGEDFWNFSIEMASIHVTITMAQNRMEAEDILNKAVNSKH